MGEEKDIKSGLGKRKNVRTREIVLLPYSVWEL